MEGHGNAWPGSQSTAARAGLPSPAAPRTGSSSVGLASGAATFRSGVITAIVFVG